ncbi:MAG: hypothetical protein A2Z25_03795 [Planctomycetes bacterium RBG_16_55_9]|nr:MAG: hypothetical protein A2Z25_03795 [Planctomycetes bacterium RBG_16_55_9]
MKSVPHHPFTVFAAGFLVLLFSSLLFFWLRFLCELSLLERMPSEARAIKVQPSGLMPPELEEDPNVAHPSFVLAILYRNPERQLGFINSLTTRFPVGPRSKVYFIESDKEYMCFDKASGQIVYQHFERQTMPDNSPIPRLFQFYIGPEGISEIPNQILGRFVEPMIDQSQLFHKEGILHELLLYDKSLQCFFRIDFDQKTVAKDSDLSKKSPAHKPIQIGLLLKNPASCQIKWNSPVAGDSRTNTWPVILTSPNLDAGPYLLVLDASGRIDLLDKQTLEFAGTAGHLPAPETYFGTIPSVRPRDLLGYRVQPLVLNKFYSEDGRMLEMTSGDLANPEPLASRVERDYLGLFAASVSRNGTAMALAIFDSEGKQIKTEYTRLPQSEGRYTSYLQSSRAALWKSPWAPVSTIGKYLAENLHPPILSLASYFTASAIEAGAGHRTLFLLPNSFVAMIGLDGGGSRLERFASALWCMTPSILLAVWLASRIGKDATLVGLSRKARRCWIAGTLAFGLPAFITYKLTRPKVALVTCANCGKPRRPDMDKCHLCNSPWHVPELTAPDWRVLDGDSPLGDQDIRGSGCRIPEDQAIRKDQPGGPGQP